MRSSNNRSKCWPDISAHLLNKSGHLVTRLLPTPTPGYAHSWLEVVLNTLVVVWLKVTTMSANGVIWRVIPSHRLHVLWCHWSCCSFVELALPICQLFHHNGNAIFTSLVIWIVFMKASIKLLENTIIVSYYHKVPFSWVLHNSSLPLDKLTIGSSQGISFIMSNTKFLQSSLEHIQLFKF